MRAVPFTASLAPQRGPRLSNLSLEQFRTSAKYLDRPAAADIAFCVAAYANGMTEDRIERAPEDDYLSRDPPALQSEVPTSGGPWRRRGGGRSDVGSGTEKP
jgi:hypothetical protein